MNAVFLYFCILSLISIKIIVNVVNSAQLFVENAIYLNKHYEYT